MYVINCDLVFVSARACKGNQVRVSCLGEIHIVSWDQKHSSRLNSRTRKVYWQTETLTVQVGLFFIVVYY